MLEQHCGEDGHAGEEVGAEVEGAETLEEAPEEGEATEHQNGVERPGEAGGQVEGDAESGQNRDDRHHCLTVPLLGRDAGRGAGPAARRAVLRNEAKAG